MSDDEEAHDEDDEENMPGDLQKLIGCKKKGVKDDKESKEKKKMEEKNESEKEKEQQKQEKDRKAMEKFQERLEVLTQPDKRGRAAANLHSIITKQTQAIKKLASGT